MPASCSNPESAFSTFLRVTPVDGGYCFGGDGGAGGAGGAGRDGVSCLGYAGDGGGKSCEGEVGCSFDGGLDRGLGCCSCFGGLLGAEGDVFDVNGIPVAVVFYGGDCIGGAGIFSGNLGCYCGVGLSVGTCIGG